MGSSWHTLGRRPRTLVAFLLIGVGWGGVITFICTSSHIWCYAPVCRLALPHIYDATLLMSDDVKAMVNQWVFRQSLGPITPIAFLEELKQLLKQWGKKGYEVLLRSSLEQCKMRNVKKHWVFCWKSHFVPRPSIKRVPSWPWSISSSSLVDQWLSTVTVDSLFLIIFTID